MVTNMSVAESRKFLSPRSENKTYVLPGNLEPFYISYPSKKSKLIQIPFPPSLNSMYRTHGKGIRLSSLGRSYKEQVRSLFIGNFEMFEGDVMLSARFYQPDRRRRDLDNLLKASLDVVSDIFGFDDSRIKGYSDVYMKYDKECPRALLIFYPMEDDA